MKCIECKNQFIPRTVVEEEKSMCPECVDMMENDTLDYDEDYDADEAEADAEDYFDSLLEQQELEDYEQSDEYFNGCAAGDDY